MKLFLELDLVTLQLRVIPPPVELNMEGYL
jgi:hypothetical protein